MAKTITCKICGQTGLSFRQVSGGGYFMHDANGNKHTNCKPGGFKAGENTASPSGEPSDEGDSGEQPSNDPPITAKPKDAKPESGPTAEGTGEKCKVEVSIESGQADGEGEASDLHIPDKIEFSGPQHENLPVALYWLVRRRKPIALFGESGSFKSTTARKIADMLFPKAIRPDGTNARFYPMSFNSQTSKGDIRGMVDAMGKFHPSPFYHAFKDGGLYLGDEFDAGNDNANLLFNMALSNSEMTFANGETVRMHPKCFVVIGTNTTGNGADRVFTGRNEIDGATKDRFKWIIWDVNPHLELLIAGVDQWKWIEYVQEARAVRKRLGITSNLLTPRASIDGAAALRDGQTWASVHSVLIRATLTADEWTQIDANMDAKIRSYNR